jgi:hypothetical protein
MSEDRVRLPRPLLDYYERVGAQVLNFRRAMVREYSGRYYTEKCLIKLDSKGAITCSKGEYAPTEEEQRAISEAWRDGDMPKQVEASRVGADAFCRTLQGQTFTFLSRRSGNVIMLQQRIENAEGERSFVPWTHFSDGAWRPMEPDDKLPLWKPERTTSTRIMVHEGAKAAMAATKIALGEIYPDHPWGDELLQYEHWGMIGGALAPHRTDWAELASLNPTEMVYVCDNDFPGEYALRGVSRYYGRRMKAIKFDKRWPTGWDLADPMPEEMFHERRYNGPCMEELLEPATWATDSIKNPKGKPTIHLKKEFIEEWFYSIKPEVFVHRDRLNHMMNSSEFNSFVGPYSDVDDVAKMMRREGVNRGVELRYDPSANPGVFVREGRRALNTHVPARIKPERGDARPFLAFMEHLIPEHEDRHQLLRWVATMIARPEERMTYGVLMISEEQGVGKGTLGEKILAPLVGIDNVSVPDESSITESTFNSWLAHKRLVIVHEIYAGHSSKAYNKLKSVITDDSITINRKYMDEYRLDNWVHIYACSNSHNALKLSVDDRRWFVPKVTEEKLGKPFWIKFNHWLRSQGGLSIVKGWAIDFLAENQDHVVMRGENAPWSQAKRMVVEDGWSPGMKLVAEWLANLKEEFADRPVILLDKELVRMIQEVMYQGRADGKIERENTIRKVAKACGWHVHEERLEARSWGRLPCRHARVIVNDPRLVEMSLNWLTAEHEPYDIVDRLRLNRAV